MHQMDGTAAGGQLVRWAVAMAALQGVPVAVENIRGARENPGLRPQHVAAVEAVGRLTDAEVAGLEVGSDSLTFEPGPISGGDVAVDIGTAGSIPLVFDTVLPLAMGASEEFTLEVTGGTDVRWSPPIDYHRQVKLPLLRSIGLPVAIDLDRRGFYPAGGGRARLEVGPGAPQPLAFSERGDLEAVSIISVATEDLADAEVAQRQATAATEELGTLVDVPIDRDVQYILADSTGTVILILADYAGVRAGFAALGEPGKPAEAVAGEALEGFREFEGSRGALEPHLADQLLPFLAELGGTVTTTRPTDHIETASALLEEFGYRVDRTETADGLELSSPGDDHH